MAKINHVGDVADWRLCLGCGACAYICPDRRVELIDELDEGMRPTVHGSGCGSCRQCLDVCPGVESGQVSGSQPSGVIPELYSAFGRVLEVWEGHASDPEIRERGASGGILTALSLYCLEMEGMSGVLQVGMDPEEPTRNRTRLSCSREELLSNSGSRYAPASVCDSLHLVEQARNPCVIIGQPSEVTALRRAEVLRPGLAEKTGLVLSFFCAGSPARRGVLDLIRSLGVNPADVSSLRYRGNGWPGKFAVTLKGHTDPVREISYQESWGFVQAYRPFSTHLSPDGTGEDADISCGDPWYRPIGADEPGSSLVVVRTEVGRRLLRAAMNAGYVSLVPVEPRRMVESQQNLIAKRGAIGGRIATLRALFLPAPRLHGYSLARNWWGLSLNEKLRSTLGTLRRVITRGYYRRKRRVAQAATRPLELCK